MGFIALVLVFVLPPSDPLRNSDGQRTDEIDEMEAAWIHETFRIYSVLAARGMDLSGDAIWLLAETIVAESKKYALEPMLIVALIKVESQFQPRAVSHAGARGLMQILPAVAHGLAGEVNLREWRGKRSLDDPITNVKMGIYYFAYLKERFKNLKVALIAYNRGPTAISSKLAGKEILPSGYAKRVLAAYHRFLKEPPAPPSYLPALRVRSQAKI